MTQLPRREDAKNTATVGGDPKLGQVVGDLASTTALAEAVELANAHGARIKAALLVEGDPASVLLETSRTRDADLIVVGAIRDDSIAGRLLGTVASEVVRKANCEVLVVRPKGVSGELETPEDAPA
ncbi:MAG: universal stress protein [Micropruina sp.]